MYILVMTIFLIAGGGLTTTSVNTFPTHEDCRQALQVHVDMYMEKKDVVSHVTGHCKEVFEPTKI